MNALILLSLMAAAAANPFSQPGCRSDGERCAAFIGNRCCPDSACVDDNAEAASFGRCKSRAALGASPKQYCSQIGADCGGLAALPCCHGICLKKGDGPTATGRCLALPKSKPERYCSQLGADCGGLASLPCCEGMCVKSRDSLLGTGTCLPLLKEEVETEEQCAPWLADCGDVKCCKGLICLRHKDRKMGTCTPPLAENGNQKYCAQFGADCGGLANLQCCRGSCRTLTSDAFSVGVCVASKSPSQDKECKVRGERCGGVSGLECCSDKYFCRIADYAHPEQGGRCEYWL